MIISLAAGAAIALAAAGLNVAPALAAVTSPAAPARAGGDVPRNGCTGYTSGGGWWVSCQAGGTPGSSGGGAQTCTWSSKVDQFFPKALSFLPPAPPGFIYLVESCGKQFFSPQLVANGGALTPAALAQQALRQLRPPLPDPQTAPPRGSDALVGLPEWLWVPSAQWAPLTVRVAVGRVWAAVTATPTQLVFSPGEGLAPVVCPGPGVAYDPSLPASAQTTPCSYTYTQSSDGLPRNAYAVTVSIQWAAAWTGSGGAGGALPGLTTTSIFTLPVAEAQALIPNGG